jgi:hypothetical protein
MSGKSELLGTICLRDESALAFNRLCLAYRR